MDSSIDRSAGRNAAVGATPAGSASTPVHVMGALGFDFGTETRRDGFTSPENFGVPLVVNSDLFSYLLVHPRKAEDVIWTLSLNSRPIYAVRPAGPHAAATYRRLLAWLVDPNVDLLSVTGRIAGSVKLLNDEVVPVVEPDPLGMQAWSSTAIAAPEPHLVGALLDAPQGDWSLTTHGTVDWVFWADHTARKAQPGQPLPGVSVGKLITLQGAQPEPIAQGQPFTTSFTWSDDEPIANSGSSNVPRSGPPQAASFSLRVPADTTPRILRLHVRAVEGPARLTASLTDGSGGPAAYADAGLWSRAPEGASFADGVYTISYCASSANQWLDVTWARDAGVCALQAASLQLAPAARPKALQGFVDRLYHELQNLGLSPRDRAKNHVAAWAVAQGASRQQLGRDAGNIFASMYAEGLMLDAIEAERSARSRPGSDFWDVSLRFFHPGNVTQRARTTVRVTVDVSAVKSVLVGSMQVTSDL